ncbi:MAG: arylesterase [Burkholderiaceae bacterium]|nr:arylesterase [Burkholderiaceae bacterium]
MQVGFEKWGAGKLAKRVLSTGVALALTLVASSAYSASKSVLVLGDSLSAEYGLVRGAGWVALLQQKLDSEKIDARLINASISGETTSGGATRLPALLKQHPAVVVIELGANDGLRGLSLNAAEANLKTMIAAAQAAHAKVVLVGMQLPPNYGPDYTDRFAAMFGKLAKENKTALVPFLLNGIVDKPQLFQGDNLHPIAKAEPTLADNVWPVLKPLLAK